MNAIIAFVVVVLIGYFVLVSGFLSHIWQGGCSGIC